MAHLPIIASPPRTPEVIHKSKFRLIRILRTCTTHARPQAGMRGRCGPPNRRCLSPKDPPKAARPTPAADPKRRFRGVVGRTFGSRVPSRTTARLLPREVRSMGRTHFQTAHRRLLGRTLTPAEPALCKSSSAGVRFLSFRTRRIAAPGRQRGCWRRFRGTRETSRASP